MKKALLVVLFALLPFAAFAQQGGEVLLTPSGTLFTLESERASDHPDVSTASSKYFVLTVRDAESVTRTIVPGSTTKGVHTDGALAYDPVSKTLFVFWNHMTGPRESNLVFASRSEAGQWTSTKPFADTSVSRSGLRVAITQKSAYKDDEGADRSIPEIVVHLAWWEDRGVGAELARYAMVTVFQGFVQDIKIHDLSEFIEKRDVDAEGEIFPDEILRHPAIFESPSHDSIDVLFGEPAENKFHRVTIKPFIPALDSRVRIPLGVRDRAIPTPTLQADAKATLGAIGVAGDRVALYVRDEKAVRYVAYRSNEWSEARSIPLDATVTTDVALEAIRNMLAVE
ncbi:MAG TPA: hypothetical protein VMU84_21470 [Thermoanaerobaculia bacterium]|nr:hypothetical protein [Thermoanaerobaculia bacterium]